MPLIDRFPSWLPSASDSPIARTKNWRLLVFSAVFSVFAAAGLIYNYSRPAEYRAGARVEITPAEMLASDTSGGADGAFLTAVLLLTARAALEAVAARYVNS